MSLCIFNTKTMSPIFRAIFISKRMCSYTSNTNILRITFNMSSTIVGNYKYKTLGSSLLVTRRSNSISSDIKPVVSNIKHSEIDESNQIDDERETVYSAVLAKPIRLMKFFSLFSSALGIMLQPFIYLKVVSESSVPSATIPLCASIGIFSVLTPIVLHSIAKKYVISIDHVPKENKYIATVYSFFGFKRQIEFTPDDVTTPTVLGAFTTCAIKQYSVFIDARQFTNQDHYIKIMSYDKPFNITEDNNGYSKKK